MGATIAQKAYEEYKKALKPNHQKKCVEDGCFSFKEYNNSNNPNLKILFLTKEPPCDFGKSNKLFNEKDFSKNNYENGFFKTTIFWKRIFLSSMAINSGLKNPQKAPKLTLSLPETYSDIENYIHKTAVINVKKVNDYKSRSDNNEILDYAKDYSKHLRAQINAYSPDVIVCGGTIEAFENIFEVNNQDGWLDEHGAKNKEYPFDLQFLGDSKYYRFGILQEKDKQYIVINYIHPSIRWEDGLYVLGINNICKIARNYIKANYKDLFSKINS